MKVKYIKDWKYNYISLNKIYNCYQKDDSHYSIIDDNWNNNNYQKEYFEIIEEFTEGEEIEVSMDWENWNKRIFIYKDKNWMFYCVSDWCEEMYINNNNNYFGYICQWKYWRKIKKQEKKFNLWDKVKIKWSSMVWIINWIDEDLSPTYCVANDWFGGDDLELLTD